MLRLPARRIVILSAICFIGLVSLQVAWIISAYEGELALYTKAKKQFESALQSELVQNDSLKKGLKDFLDHYNQNGNLNEAQTGWFYLHFVQLIDFTPVKPQFDVYLDGMAIAKLHHNGQRLGDYKIIISTIAESDDTTQVKEAGKLCVHCILGAKDELHQQYDYQILLFYKNRLPAFFERLWFLILGSFLLLIVLGLLFREIIKKYKAEKKLSEAKNDFINNLTHEMQTPVFAIQMANRLIKEKTGEQTELTPLTSIIEKEAGQLKQHAARILDMASLETGQVELSKELTELNSFINEKAPTIELMLQAKKGELKLNLSTAALYSEVDPVHFNNVLLSLADNSIKYNNAVPNLTLETGEMNQMIYVRLTDNGIGINHEYLPYVKDKFFRVPNIKRHGAAGFGLGLSYVKHIVDLHGGRFDISSEEGKGTTVTILLPKAASNA